MAGERVLNKALVQLILSRVQELDFQWIERWNSGFPCKSHSFDDLELAINHMLKTEQDTLFNNTNKALSQTNGGS
ncbi:hypothetical protein Taro_045230 [Colocasia esculenta]|uniref:Uncharacterized protein n=1 Tax=Colocasia esculenta TaxID=4460 RepID=A0A843WLF9_COLES|nr:hypothetical protein [Colocasia esculenta]